MFTKERNSLNCDEKQKPLSLLIKKSGNKGCIFSRLIRSNSGYSSKSFFLVSITLIGLLLLLVPVFTLGLEAWYNHTIQTNLSDMAAYIASVAAIFATGGITKAWSEKYEQLPGKDGILGTEDDIYVKRKVFKCDDEKNTECQ